jgi:hypothetical protein
MEGPPEVRRGRLENIARECSTDETVKSID